MARVIVQAAIPLPHQPPLVLSDDDAEMFVRGLDDVLGEIGS